MAEFTEQALTGPEWHVYAGVMFREIGFEGVVMRGVDVADLEIDGEIGRLVVNGVEVGPYVEAELDRRYPERAAMRPTDPAGFRAAWDIVERFWDELVERARELEPAALHESVDGEWSFVQTLRHLVFATDTWVRRAIQGDPAPWDPLGLPWSGLPATPGVPDDRTAHPSLETVLALRRDRMATVREVVDALTDDTLAADTVPVEGPGWPEPRSYPVRKCLRVVLNEEWEHHLFAARDLAVLAARGGYRPVIPVYGRAVDPQTRCAHWNSELDVVAIEFACCRRFFPCHRCHEETADHPAATWPATAFDRPAVLCGVCRERLTIAAYLAGDDTCPHCGAGFNPGCRAHRHLYFAAPAGAGAGPPGQPPGRPPG